MRPVSCRGAEGGSSGGPDAALGACVAGTYNGFLSLIYGAP